MVRRLWHGMLWALWGCVTAGAREVSQPPSGVRAQSGPAVAAPCPGQSDWARTTRGDVGTLAGWVDEVYPALVDPLNPGFSERWGEAVARARGRAEQVTVEAEGQRRPWTLPWRMAPASAVISAVAAYTRIAWDHGELLQLDFQEDGAAWITVGNLAAGEPHAKLLEALTRAAPQIRQAPYIVWDLRGNGGGDSTLGDALAAAVWGQGTLLPGRPRRHPKLWRASARLLEYIEEGHVENVDWILPPMQEAVRRGQALFTVPGHDDITDAAVAVRPPAHTGPVFVLTDAGCFSSCILFRNLLTRMGAVQVGDPTGCDEVYGESWFVELLPSKLGEFMLPIAIFGDYPEELGGTLPDLPWQGSAGDEAGLRQFIAAAAARGNKQR